MAKCGECLMEHVDIIELDEDGSCPCCKRGHQPRNLVKHETPDNKMLGRIDKAVEDAELAFWAEIAKAFPEAKSGDLGPDVVHILISTMRDAVTVWVWLNVPHDDSK